MKSKNQEGSALIELVISTPILLLFLFGAGDFGRVFYTSIEVANAAAAGANYGSFNASNMTDTAGIAAAATNEAPDITNVQVTSSQVCQDNNRNVVSCTTSGAYKYVKVTAAKTFSTLFNYPFIPSSVALSTTVMMRAQ
jgi:Flp pilus assembly protein TadG